jgi:Tfp pilus assembly protein PilE
VIANKKQMLGVSLIEVILALLIGISLLLISIRQYQSFKLDQDIRQLQYNVDTIFQAMNRYYQANCFGTTHPSTGVVTSGTLNPALNPANPFLINITTDLANTGFLTNRIPRSLIVNTAGPATNQYNGYVAQFNQSTQSKMLCISSGCASQTNVGTIVTWRAQVAVLLQKPPQAQQYKNALTADCLSNLGAGGTVIPCTPVSISGNYLVWERLPSFASPNSESESWVLNPTVNQFTQMYTTYPGTYLLNTQGQITAQPTNPSQNYLCGS